MHSQPRSNTIGHPSHGPRPVSDRRLQVLDWAGRILVVAMSLGPLSAYAIFGG
jgi:hypothetical protein